MSSTRHAKPGKPLAQERYMSSPEFVELRGISGNAVSAKASILQCKRKRSLLYFIQSQSLQPGGLTRLAQSLTETFPNLIGTETMHQSGITPGKVYGLNDATMISVELGIFQPRKKQTTSAVDDWDNEIQPSSRDLKIPSSEEANQTAEHFLSICRERLKAELPSFLVELCINPRLQLYLPGEASEALATEREIARNLDVELEEVEFRSAQHPYFKNIVPALFALQEAYEKTASEQFVKTSIGNPIFQTLDFGCSTGSMVVIEGDARLGKTTAAEAWCDIHRGQARFVSLSGVSHKTGFFRAIAKALGIASSYAKTSTDMQARVEDVLQRSRLMLVIDEAHYLWPQSERVYSRPELVDWINTALVNHRVPVALVTTPQFSFRMRNVEKQTGWNSEQFKGRVKRFVKLPTAPTKHDIEAVTRKLLPEGDKDSIKLIVGYALSSKRHMPAIVDAIDEARMQAKLNGRDLVTFDDIDAAIQEYRIPSDIAQASAFEKPDETAARGKRSFSKPDAKPLQAPCMTPERTVPNIPNRLSDGNSSLLRLEEPVSEA